MTPSEFARQSFLDRGFSPDKIKLIRFGTDLTENSSRTDASKPHAFTALFVGQVGLRKGILYALEAWEQLQLPNTKFYVVGGETPETSPLLEPHRHNPSIVFTGHTDPTPYYKHASVLIFPSLEEGSAFVTYEAMQYRLPVITTFNAGSLISDSYDGYLVPTQNTEIIIQKLQELVANPQLGLAMGASAYKTVSAYPWSGYGDSVAKFYQQLL